uniref:Reverse transcriptase domain-containing protein n=1 Tax=Tanacetum cinerariifolium TaxID=118510 RepID=A0A6L2KU89_TANCI|nr:reverse transcriptase domain-containing protein [Tanacetum cinerariifolium]
MNTASTLGSGPLPSDTIANPKGELKSITTQSGIVLDGPSIPIPPSFINPKEDERVEETLTDQDLAEYTIKVPPPLVQKPKPPSQRNFVVHQRDPLHPNIPYPSRMLKQKHQEKDEVQIHKFSQMFKQLHINITLADSLILIPKYQKMLKALLSNKDKLLKLANTPLNENCLAVILKKLPKKLRDPGKFLIPCGFSELKCKALADLEVKDDVFDLEGGNVLTRKYLDLDSTKDLHPLHNVNPLSDGTTYSSPNHLLEEIEYVLNHNPIKEMDSILEDLVDEGNLANLNDNLVDTMPKMFTEEHALDYSSLTLYDEYDDDLFEVKSDTEYVYDDPFDSKGEKIKEFKLLIDELDLRRSSDFLPSSKYDSFLFEDFSEGDALPLTNNEDKNLAISHASLILEDFDPPLYELSFFKEVLGAETPLLFSSENEEKVFKLGILTSKVVHSSLIIELSHRGYKFSKSLKFFKS